MKKLLIVLLVAAMAMFGVQSALAGGFGYLDIDAKAKAKSFSFDYSMTPWFTGPGLAIGGGIDCAKTKAGADGFIFNGTIEAEVEALAGGLSATDAWTDVDFWGKHREIRVGSVTENFATIEGKVKVKAEVEPGTFGLGEVNGEFKGKAAQASANASFVTTDWAFDSHGFTGGIAAQGSAGEIEGGAFAVVVGYATEDYYFGGEPGEKGYYIKVNGENAGEIKYFKNGHPENESEWEFLGKYKRDGHDIAAGAGAGAGIDMYGWSYSESYRAIDYFDGGKTESLGTFVGAGTEVESYGYDYDWDKGFISYSGAYVDGHWCAAGGVASITKQGNEFGGAKASAVGFYTGSGGLNSTFTGSAEGYTQTSITTINGLNGSINAAAAGMQVTAATKSDH